MRSTRSAPPAKVGSASNMAVLPDMPMPTYRGPGNSTPKNLQHQWGLSNGVTRSFEVPRFFLGPAFFYALGAAGDTITVTTKDAAGTTQWQEVITLNTPSGVGPTILIPLFESTSTIELLYTGPSGGGGIMHFMVQK